MTSRDSGLLFGATL